MGFAPLRFCIYLTVKLCLNSRRRTRHMSITTAPSREIWLWLALAIELFVQQSQFRYSSKTACRLVLLQTWMVRRLDDGPLYLNEVKRAVYHDVYRRSPGSARAASRWNELLMDPPALSELMVEAALRFAGFYFPHTHSLCVTFNRTGAPSLRTAWNGGKARSLLRNVRRSSDGAAANLKDPSRPRKSISGRQCSPRLVLRERESACICSTAKGRQWKMGLRQLGVQS